MKVKPLVATSLLVALAAVLNMFPIVHMPQGGTAALCPTLFIVLAGFIFGKKYGVIACLASGLISYMIDPWFLSVPQFLLDYIFSYLALSIGAFIFANDTKFALEKYYIVGVFFSFIFGTISGYVFFADNTPAGMNPIVYSIIYNAGYRFVEAVLVLFLLRITSFRSILFKEINKLRA